MMKAQGNAPRPPKARASGAGYLLLSTAALNILSLALPVMTLQIYDRILPNPDSGTLPVLMAGVTATILLETCLRLARAWMMGWNAAVYEHTLSSASMRHILASDISKTGSLGIGEFLHRMSAISKLKDFESGYVLVTLAELMFIPLFLGVIFYIAPPLAPIPLILLLTFAVISAVQGRKLQRELKRRDTLDDDRYNFLIECLKGIHTIKAFALENLFARKYERLQEKSGLASFRAAEASTAAFNAGTMLSHLMMAVLITAGAFFVLGGAVTTGGLIATLQLSGRLMQPAQRGLALWSRYQDFSIAREKIDELFALPLHQSAPAMTFPKPAGRLSVKNLSFGGILQDISFDISPGEVISISGGSSSGKTALMEIIAGLYSPDSGEIWVDGLRSSEYTPEELVSHIGYMAPSSGVFRGSIRENLTRFGGIPEPAAQEVARMLHVDRDVARLPSGFDTQLQANGADQVPPGLRQRIALTRILAPRPKIILFDEADRALDREGYNLVFSLLGKLARKTAMILISDDANIAALADRNYVLRDGRLFEKITLPDRKAAV